MLADPDYNNCSFNTSKVKNIPKIYVCKCCIYIQSIEQSKGGSNSQHSMLDSYKKNTDALQ